jgi:hypothetical protein
MIDERALKDAFDKVKNDIFTLGNEFSSVKNDIFELKNQLNFINDSINQLKIDILTINSRPSYASFPTDIPTHEFKIPSIQVIPSDTPTVPVEIGGLKYPNLDSSSGNRGAPTDKQTNQQTDIYDEKLHSMPLSDTHRPLSEHIKKASQMLDSLDGIKKEIRLKFKGMTNQEMLVFSTVYQLEEAFPEGVEYRQIAAKLRLSESSIRDYIQKLITKGIPVDKLKLNNKKILLKISSNLKNIAPLETLIKLREL